MSLEGKNAVITGSTSGIGLDIAKTLAREGCNVMLNGLGDTDGIKSIRTGLARETGRRVMYSDADMRNPDEIAAMIGEAANAFGTLDILVNNAGIQHVAPVEDFPAEKWDAIIAIDLTAAFHTIRHIVPMMKARRFGRIINVASAHALVASPFKSAYVAAKHGLAGLTKTVALEVAEENITVNAVCPGYVLTPLVEGQIPDTARARGLTEEQVNRDVLLAAQPTKEFVTAEQIAALTVFLCGEAAASITGAILPVDGGWTAH